MMAIHVDVLCNKSLPKQMLIYWLPAKKQPSLASTETLNKSVLPYNLWASNQLSPMPISTVNGTLS